MRARCVQKRCWLEDAHLVFICCCDFASICTAIQTTDTDVIVYRTRYYLNPFKVTRKDDYVTSSSISLQKENSNITFQLNLNLKIVFIHLKWFVNAVPYLNLCLSFSVEFWLSFLLRYTHNFLFFQICCNYNVQIKK